MRRRALAVLTLVALTGCAGGNADGPSASQLVSSPTPALTPTPTPTAATDPADGIAIGPPYSLQRNSNSASQIEAAVRDALASVPWTVDLGTREAVEDPDGIAAIVVALRLGGLEWPSATVLEDIARRMAGPPGGSYLADTIRGTPVLVVTSHREHDVLFILGDRVVMCFGTPGTTHDVEVATAIIEANGGIVP